MPELPEVETITRQLNSILPGNTITKIKVNHPKSFQGDYRLVQGNTIQSVTRKAKMVIISFERSEEKLLTHLKMTGQLIFIPAPGSRTAERVVGGHPSADWVDSLPSKHTRVIISFADKSTLYFNDMRIFGWMKLYNQESFNNLISAKPPDVIEPEFTPDFLYHSLQTSARPIKTVILDQAKMGGIGNIYANDALWLAKIHPALPANQLSKKQAIALHQAIVTVIEKGIKLGGATESDYVDSRGMGGTYQLEFLTYKQEGGTCQRRNCYEVIIKSKIGGRGSYWCPHCQRVE